MTTTNQQPGALALDSFNGHTPGPWTVRRVYGRRAVPDAVLIETTALESQRDPCILAVREDWVGMAEPGLSERHERMAADLKLIAAAPTLAQRLEIATADYNLLFEKYGNALARVKMLERACERALQDAEDGSTDSRTQDILSAALARTEQP